MKINKLTFLSIIFLCLISNVKAQGINFVNNLNEAIQLAQKENKMIFVDFYTSWCVPCKVMAADIFPQKIVGDFYNTNFINVKVQCDDKGEGEQIGKRYKISAYPTLAYLDKNGDLIHSIAGGMDAKGFIELAKTALDPNKNQLKLVKEWDAGNREHEFMKTYFQTLIKSYRREKAHYDFEKHFESLNKTQKANKDNFELMRILNVGPFASSFEYLENNKKDYYKTIGKQEINDMIANAYLWYFKNLQSSGESNKDLTEFNTKMKLFKAKKYSFYNEYAAFYEVLGAKTPEGKYDIELYQKLGTAFLNKYGLKNDAYTTSLSHTLGNLTAKPNQGAAGIKWMEDLIARNNDPKFLSTYFYITWRNYQWDKALEIAEQMKTNAIKANKPTSEIDKNIQMIKDLKIKYN